MSNVQAFLDGLKFLLEQKNPPPPEHLQVVIANTPREELVSALIVATMCWEPGTYSRLLNLLIGPLLDPDLQSKINQAPYPKRYLNASFFETFLLQLKTIPFTQLLSNTWLNNICLSIQAAILIANATLKRVAENKAVQGNSQLNSGNANVIREQEPQSKYTDEGEELGDVELAFKGGLTVAEWKSISHLVEYMFSILLPTVGTMSSMWKSAYAQRDGKGGHNKHFQKHSAKSIDTSSTMPISEVSLRSVQLYKEFCVLIKNVCCQMSSLVYERIPAVTKKSANEGFSWGIPALPITVAINILRNVISRRIFLNAKLRCDNILLYSGSATSKDFIEKVLEFENTLDSTETEILSELISNDSSIAYGMIVSCFRLLQVYNSWSNKNQIKLADLDIGVDLMEKIQKTVNKDTSYPQQMFTLFAIRQASDGLAPILLYDTVVFANAMDMYSILISLAPMQNHLANPSQFLVNWGYFAPGYFQALSGLPQDSDISLNAIKRHHSFFASSPSNSLDVFEISVVRMLLAKLDLNSLSDINIQSLVSTLMPLGTSFPDKRSRNLSLGGKNDEDLLLEELADNFTILARKIACVVDLYTCPTIENYYRFDVLHKSSNFSSSNSGVTPSLDHLSAFESRTTTKYWEDKFSAISGQRYKTGSVSSRWLDTLLELESFSQNSKLANVWSKILNWVDIFVCITAIRNAHQFQFNLLRMIETLSADYLVRLSATWDAVCGEFSTKPQFTNMGFSVLLALYGCTNRIETSNPNFFNDLTKYLIKDAELAQNPAEISKKKALFISKWEKSLIFAGSGPYSLSYYIVRDMKLIFNENPEFKTSLNKKVLHFLINMQKLIGKNPLRVKKKFPHKSPDEQTPQEALKLKLNELKNSIEVLYSGSDFVFNSAIGLQGEQKVESSFMKLCFDSVLLHTRQLSNLLNDFSFILFENKYFKEASQDLLIKMNNSKRKHISAYWSNFTKMTDEVENQKTEVETMSEFQDSLNALFVNKATEKLASEPHQGIIGSGAHLLYENLSSANVNTTTNTGTFNTTEATLGSNSKNNSHALKENQGSSNPGAGTQNTLKSSLSLLSSEDYFIDTNNDSLDIAKIATTILFESVTEINTEFKGRLSKAVASYYSKSLNVRLIPQILVAYMIIDSGQGVEAILGPIADKMFKSSLSYSRDDPFFDCIRSLFIVTDYCSSSWAFDFVTKPKLNHNIIYEGDSESEHPFSKTLIMPCLRILLFLTSLKYGKRYGATPLYAWLTDLLSIAHPTMLYIYCLSIISISMWGPKSISTFGNSTIVAPKLFDQSYPQENNFYTKVRAYLNLWKIDNRMVHRLSRPLTAAYSKVYWDKENNYFLIHEHNLAKCFVSSKGTIDLSFLRDLSTNYDVDNPLMPFLEAFFDAEQTTPIHKKISSMAIIASLSYTKSNPPFQKLLETILKSQRSTPSDWFSRHIYPVLLDGACSRMIFSNLPNQVLRKANKFCLSFICSLIKDKSLADILVPTAEGLDQTFKQVKYNSTTQIYSDDSEASSFFVPVDPLRRLVLSVELLSENEQELLVSKAVYPSLLYRILQLFYKDTGDRDSGNGAEQDASCLAELNMISLGLCETDFNIYEGSEYNFQNLSKSLHSKVFSRRKSKKQNDKIEKIDNVTSVEVNNEDEQKALLHMLFSILGASKSASLTNMAKNCISCIIIPPGASRLSILRQGNAVNVDPNADTSQLVAGSANNCEHLDNNVLGSANNEQNQILAEHKKYEANLNFLFESIFLPLSLGSTNQNLDCSYFIQKSKTSIEHSAQSKVLAAEAQCEKLIRGDFYSFILNLFALYLKGVTDLAYTVSYNRVEPDTDSRVNDGQIDLDLDRDQSLAEFSANIIENSMSSLATGIIVNDFFERSSYDVNFNFSSLSSENSLNSTFSEFPEIQAVVTQIYPRCIDYNLLYKTSRQFKRFINSILCSDLFIKTVEKNTNDTSNLESLQDASAFSPPPKKVAKIAKIDNVLNLSHNIARSLLLSVQNIHALFRSVLVLDTGLKLLLTTDLSTFCLSDLRLEESSRNNLYIPKDADMKAGVQGFMKSKTNSVGFRSFYLLSTSRAFIESTLLLVNSVASSIIPVVPVVLFKFLDLLYRFGNEYEQKIQPSVALVKLVWGLVDFSSLSTCLGLYFNIENTGYVSDPSEIFLETGKENDPFQEKPNSSVGWESIAHEIASMLIEKP